MNGERGDLSALVQRLASTLTRLFGERIDLAKLELRDEAERILAVLARLLLYAAALAVGLVLLSLAATDLLSPFIRSRALRLALVGIPLAAVGTRGALRLARALAPPQRPD